MPYSKLIAHVASTLVLVCGMATVQATAEIDRDATLQDMRKIFSSIQTLLPLSVDDKAFASEAKREEIRSALERLASRADHVSGHIAGDDRRIRFLAASLSRETREAQRHFENGRYENAQFMIHRFTDFCIACHTRIPSRNDSPLARDFVSSGAMAKLLATS